MYLLVDRAQMRIIAKHKDKTLLDAEAPEGTAAVLVDESNLDNDLNVFTDYELRVLYRTLGTVTNMGALNRPNLVGAIHKLAHYLPMTTLPRPVGLFTEPAAAQDTTSLDRVPARTSAPPAQGVRGTIWSVADLMWEAAGKPTDKAAVLALRKQIMNTLETENGVKRTSASNELGNWQKARIQVN